MKNFAIVTAALVSLGAASISQANSVGRPYTSAPEARWLSLGVLKAKAAALGYKVQKAKVKAACGEIYALDRNGIRTEPFLDPTSGDIVAKM